MLAGYDKPRHKTTISAAGAITEIKTDMWGNRLYIKDPDAGEIYSTYNGFGELLTQKDANDNVTAYQYDLLGRVIQKKFSTPPPRITTQTIDYIYDYLDRNNKQKGKLYQINIDNVASEIFYYDNLGRLSQHNKKFDGATIAQRHTYNTYGQLQTLTYPDNFKVNYSYTATGKLDEIRNNDGNTLIYKVNSRNKYNQTTNCEYGNGVMTEYSYNPYGLLTRINTGKQAYSIYIEQPNEEKGKIPYSYKIYYADSSILNYRYAYNDLGLMSSRSESVKNRSETFFYDNLDRLKHVASKTGIIQSISYANNGNISTNSNVGTYSYGTTMRPPKPHAVTKIEPINQNVISANQCDVTYNYFNQPTKITEGEYELDIFYNANQQRNKTMKYQNDALESTHYYFNKYFEIEIDSAQVKRFYSYIYGNNGVVALNLRSTTYVPDTIGGSNNDTLGNDRDIVLYDSIYYIHTDHLGSYCAITNANKQVVLRNHFDAWGNYAVRDFIPYFNGEPLTNRGFTGHEHYPYFKIINMNGRLYDPVIGRFFSPDKYVANSTFTQDFNRYTYARNCPLMYTDPDGEFIQYIFGAIMGAFSGYQMGKAAGATGWKMAGFILGGAGIGAATAGIGTAVSTAISTSATTFGVIGTGVAATAISGTVAGAASGLGFGLLNASMTGQWNAGAIFKGMGIGAFTGFVGGTLSSYIGGSAGALVGGAASSSLGTALNGGKWQDILLSGLTGAATSAVGFEMQMLQSYAKYNNGARAQGYLTYKGFRALSIGVQRSFAWNREMATYIMNDGNVSGIQYLGKDGGTVNRPASNDIRMLIHTHQDPTADIQYHSPEDIYNARQRSDVISTLKTYSYNPANDTYFSYYNDYTLHHLLIRSPIISSPNLYFRPAIYSIYGY